MALHTIWCIAFRILIDPTRLPHALSPWQSRPQSINEILHESMITIRINKTKAVRKYLKLNKLQIRTDNYYYYYTIEMLSLNCQNICWFYQSYTKKKQNKITIHVRSKFKTPLVVTQLTQSIWDWVRLCKYTDRISHGIKSE